ncbi:50S ribosomal protein L16 [Candidatus Peregrinibacteria bacterium CG10_big_fil_rev_8_21_14_0_10_49_10]|nr:MAG: 50S ribosomal protein L16 [Candidatus Peregrinibacteria bacterium CG10_big_fil_rev_8_21_14_0_10_49_10]
MLEPKKTKHRKFQRNRGAFYGKAQRGATLAFGSVGLKVVVSGEITARQLEAARRAMTHSVQRGGKIWIRVFPDIAVSRKAAEVPMGSGKGTPDHWSCIVKAGTMIFEMDGLSQDAAREALRLASHKLPLKTKVIARILR